MKIRLAQAADAAAVADIYDAYVRDTAITFATQTPTAAHYAKQMADERYPFVVAEAEGQVCGFAYGAAFRTKEAYRWDVELTIYLRPGLEGRGMGHALMERCLQLLRAQGYMNAYSCITLPNPRSIGLHNRFGFREVGRFPKTGYKLGCWHDVVWLYLPLNLHSDAPQEPRLLSLLQEDCAEYG